MSRTQIFLENHCHDSKVYARSSILIGWVSAEALKVFDLWVKPYVNIIAGNGKKIHKGRRDFE